MSYSDTSNFSPIVEKSIDDIDPDLDKLIVEGSHSQQRYLARLKYYLSYHIETVNAYAIMNFKFLKQIGRGGHASVIKK